MLCALSPALAELTEASADDLYILRHWEEHGGTASAMKPGEKKLLVTPDGHHKTEYFQDGYGVTIHGFRLYHERNGKCPPDRAADSAATLNFLRGREDAFKEWAPEPL